jgi:transcriptional regulator of acetoin/glycerol metabolism
MPTKEELVLLMEQFRGKVAMAARHLGVTRPRLYRLLWSHEIKPETFRLP